MHGRKLLGKEEQLLVPKLLVRNHLETLDCLGERRRQPERINVELDPSNFPQTEPMTLAFTEWKDKFETEWDNLQQQYAWQVGRLMLNTPIGKMAPLK